MVAAGMPTKRRIPSFHAVPEGNKKAPSPGVLRLGDLGAQDDGEEARLKAWSPLPSRQICALARRQRIGGDGRQTPLPIERSDQRERRPTPPQEPTRPFGRTRARRTPSRTRPARDAV